MAHYLRKAFIRDASVQVNEAISRIGGIAHLANPKNYKSTSADADVIAGALMEAIRRTMAKFESSSDMPPLWTPFR
jgi:hypothetical protein